MVVNKDDFIGRKVPFAAEYITPNEIAAILTKGMLIIIYLFIFVFNNIFI
jgi:hypothetical protein